MVLGIDTKRIQKEPIRPGSALFESLESVITSFNPICDDICLKKVHFTR